MHGLTCGRVGARKFDLETELARKNARPFRLFSLRRLGNRAWFGLSARRDPGGKMMFVAACRI
jgi:hypothetical protein